MNPLLTTKFGPMIARAARTAVNGHAPAQTQMTEDQIWEKMSAELPHGWDDVPAKNGYGLVISGGVTELSMFRKYAGEPNAFQYGEDVYLRRFDTKEARVDFEVRLMQFLKPLHAPDIHIEGIQGMHCDKRPVALATLCWQGKEYDVRKEYGYGYPYGTILFDWEENDTSCDCNRAILIERFYPGTTGAHACDDRPCSCGEIVVTAFGIALAEGKVNHGLPYPAATSTK